MTTIISYRTIGLNSQQIDAVKAAWATFEAVCDVKFTTDDYDSSKNKISVELSYTMGSSSGGMVSFPYQWRWNGQLGYWEHYKTAILEMNAQYVNQYGMNHGQPMFLVLLHEMQHALGYFTHSAAPAILSVMHPSYSPWGPYTTITPMAEDVEWLQNVYGANKIHNNGNNTYNISDDTDGQISRFNIWDTGGEDTIQYNGQHNVTLDLRPQTGDYSTVSGVSGVYGQQGQWYGSQFTISKGVTIENAIGNNGNDLLIGNDANNRLEGQGGNDTIYGGAGADVIDGGNGDDRIYGDSAISGNLLKNGDFEGAIKWAPYFSNGWWNSVSDPFGPGSWTAINWSGFRLEGGQGSQYVNLTDWRTGFGGVQQTVAVQANSTYSIDLDTAGGLGASLEVYWNGRLVASINQNNNWMDSNITFTTGSETSGTLMLKARDGTWVWQTLDNVRLLKLDTSISYDDKISGGAGNDWISAGVGHDVLFGGTGIDQLFGGSGNDTIDGGAGADQIFGGLGEDTASYATSTSGVTVTVNGSSAGGDAQGDRLFDIENITGSSHNDSLTGDAGNNKLFGGAGNDLLSGGQGADTLDGGAGEDTASYASSTAGVTVNLNGAGLGSGSGGDAAGDIITNVENIIGSAFNDILTGDAGNNRIHGGAGNDIISGGAGSDRIHGGEGADTLNGGDGDDRIWGSNLLSNGAFDERTGLLHNAGWGRIWSNLADWSTSVGIWNYENYLSPFGPSVGSLQNLLGWAVQSGSIQQTVTANAGQILEIDLSAFWYNNHRSTITVEYDGKVIGTYTFSPSDLGRIVDLKFEVIASSSALLKITGTGHHDLHLQNVRVGYKGEAGDVIQGGNGTDWLYGTGGHDVISGGDGHDLIFGFSGDDTLNGGAGDDHLRGGDGADRLFGGAGADVIDGGNGDDRIYGDGGFDGNLLKNGDFEGAIKWAPFFSNGWWNSVSDPFGGGSWTAINWSGFRLEGAWGSQYVNLSDWRTGFGGLQQHVNVQANTTYSIDLDTAGGVGSALEIYWNGRLITTINENGNWMDNNVTFTTGSETSGTLLLKARDGTWTWQLLDNVRLSKVENTVSYNDTLSGGAGNDWIAAGMGNDVLFGGTGHDSLFGGDHVDELNGGAGNDMLYGGRGSDMFVFRSGETGTDRIMDFDDGADKIHVGNFFGAQDITAQNFSWMVAIQQLSASQFLVNLVGRDQSIIINDSGWRGTTTAFNIDYSDFIV